MLRRSFAEFHAQRAQPGKSAALSAGAAQLGVYRSTPWPDCIRGCDREQLVEYCDISNKISDINEQLQVVMVGQMEVGGLWLHQIKPSVWQLIK